MARTLYPPLEVIRAGLFESPDMSNHAASCPPEQELPHEGDESESMPAFIRELMARQAATAQAYPSAPPAVGQILSLSAIPAADGSPPRQLGRSCGVLLAAHLGGKQWSGWLVAQEVDYASHQDLVLEEADGPLDPAAGMVQAWNPVRVQLLGHEQILGKLSPIRLAAVLALAEHTDAPPTLKPSPGRIGAWDLDNHLTVLTGTPPAGKDDPRQGYRTLYRQLAEEITRAAQPEIRTTALPARSQGFFGRLMQTFIRPAWTFGAMAATALLALNLLLESGSVQQIAYWDASSTSRQASPQVDGKVVRITLDEQAHLSVLRELLALPGASLRHLEFQGDLAIVWLHLKPGKAETIDAQLVRITKLPAVRKVQRISE